MLDTYPVLVAIMKFYRMSASITGGRTTTLTFTNTNDYIENGAIGHYAGKTGSGGGGTKESLVVGWIAPSGARIVAAIVASDTDAHRYADMDALLGQLVVDVPPLASFTWTPASLSNPVNWLDPSDTSHLYQTTDTSTPVTASGQTVGRIEDKSGNATHATQSTSGSRPTYTVSGGASYLSFDGGDWLTYGAQVLGATHLFADATDAFLVLVAGQYVGDPGTMLAKASASAGTRTFQLFGQTSTGAEPGVYFRGSSGIKDDKNIVANTTPCVMGAMWDGTDAAFNVGDLLGWKAGDAVGSASEESRTSSSAPAPEAPARG